MDDDGSSRPEEAPSTSSVARPLLSFTRISMSVYLYTQTTHSQVAKKEGDDKKIYRRVWNERICFGLLFFSRKDSGAERAGPERRLAGVLIHSRKVAARQRGVVVVDVVKKMK